MISNRESCIIFNMISGVGFVKFNALLEHFGEIGLALEASISELQQIRGIGSQLAQRIFNWRDEIDLEEELTRVNQGGAQLLTYFDPEYPNILRQIPDPPLCLYVVGKLPDFDTKNMIAIVGSRRATNYGRKMARILAEQAVASNWGVVSGLAYGIDFEAHDATVKSNGITVAVLGGGLARIHPQDHIPLARQIINSNGAVISEYPMNFPVSRTSFPRRNRIIAGLSLGTVLVESQLNAGGMLTANLAIDYNRTVFAVPGSLDNPLSSGCHSLIKRGEAKLVESFKDVLDEFGGELQQGTLNLSEPTTSYQGTTPTLNTIEQQIVDFLAANGETSYDSLVLSLNINSSTLSSKLAELEMRMIILRNPGRRYILR